MKVAIIGAGNMGGAIARGLAQGHYVRVQDITVTNPSMPKLEKLKAEFPAIQVSTDNHEAADADVVIIAVKPWKVEEVLKPLRLRQPQVLVSVAAGMPFEDLAHFVDPEMPMFRIIPNTAISLRASMTLIACRNASEQQTLTMLDLFNEMGLAMLIEEKTACGGHFAYVMRHCLRAEVCAGSHAGRCGSRHPSERRHEDGGADRRRGGTSFVGKRRHASGTGDREGYHTGWYHH